VYTIGDEVSFISFMIDLRRMITDRPVCKDILDEHKDRNLSSTHEHPLLPRQHARHPERWLHVKLQVAGKEMLWTTLLMRDDNLYVHGFINKQGGVYGLVDKNKDSAMVLPDPYLNRRVKELKWSVQYITMLKAQSNDDVMKKLAGAHLGREFVMKAVGVLSRYPDVAAGDNPRLALVGLIFMVCESARMNPLHNAFARGWSTGTGFTEELMKRYVWNYSDKSRKLRKWKDKRYAESGELPHPIKELQDVYLVLNTTSTSSGSTTKEAGDGGSSRGSGSGPNQPREAGDNAGSKTSSASQPGKAGDAGTGGGSAFQPGDAGHAGPRRGNNCSQPQDAYHDAHDDGRPMVEILAIHADHLVVGTENHCLRRDTWPDHLQEGGARKAQ
jgi:virulence-associated protein VapD